MLTLFSKGSSTTVARGARRLFSRYAMSSIGLVAAVTVCCMLSGFSNGLTGFGGAIIYQMIWSVFAWGGVEGTNLTRLGSDFHGFQLYPLLSRENCTYVWLWFSEHKRF